MAKTKETEYLEKKISEATSKIGVFGCFEVTIGLGGKERVDYMTVDTKGIWRCYEIKCSLADFRSKASKSFHGHFNYYVLTQELYEKVKAEIPKHIGIYVGSACKRGAKRQELKELTINEDVLKISMIRSLSRDAQKYYTSNNPQAIERFERQINYYRKEWENAKERERDARSELVELKNKLYLKLGNDWREKLNQLLELV